MLLKQEEISKLANQLEGWTVEGKELKTTREFKDFVEAINFINKLVNPAEAAGHHPDIFISYNKVSITLTTHDEGGLTQLDFDMANTISKID